jgi:hypothetical protein
MSKLAASISIQVLPPSAIARERSRPLGIADVFAAQLTPQGDTGDIYFPGDPRVGLTTDAAMGQAAFDYISSSLDFVVFEKDGRCRFGMAGIGIGGARSAGGFVLKAREIPVNCVMRGYNPSAAGAIEMPEGRELWRFRSMRSAGGWSQRLPDRAGASSAVYNAIQAANKTLEVVSVNQLRAHEGFAARIEWIGTHEGQTNDMGFRLWWGGKYSIVFRESLARKIVTPELNILGPKIEGQAAPNWQLLRRLDLQSGFRFEGTTIIRVMLLGGITVVSINGESWWVRLDNAYGWDAAPIRWTALGVSPAVELSRLSYLSPDTITVTETAPPTGTQSLGVVRRKFTGVVQARGDGQSPTMLTAAKGWSDGGALIAIEPVLTSHFPANSDLTYEVALQADPQGILTPLASAAAIQVDSELPAAAPTALELRPFLQSYEVTLPEPEVSQDGSGTTTAQFTCTLNRRHLTRKAPAWESTLQQFSPITVDLGWDTYDSFSGSVITSRSRVFEGYVLNPDRELTAHNNQSLRLLAHDETCRFKDPAGFIDERFAPLDVIPNFTGADLYGAQAFQFLLELQSGVAMAASINGTGNPLAFFSSGHYPLLSYGATPGYFPSVEPIAEGGFTLPPPFGRYMMEWFAQLGGFDHAVFYWGISPLNPAAGVVPIYGDYRYIVAAWDALYDEAFTLPDDAYSAGDADVIFGTASVAMKAEKNYNEVRMYGKRPTDGALASLTPALPYAIGVAELPPTDANSAVQTWRRTLSAQLDYLDKAPGLAQNLANLTLAQLRGVEPKEVTFTIPRGDTGLHWGRRIRARMERASSTKQSDGTLGINSLEEFRIKQVTHRGTIGGDTSKWFETSIVARPMTSSGV